MKWTPRRLKFVLNLYGPFVGAGVRVTHIAENWREVRVAMRLRWYNRNAVGTHFGGSLYTMVDPHVMLMLIQLLGDRYVVWDKAAAIEFVRPGKGTVHATLCVTDEDLASIRAMTTGGRVGLPQFDIEIVDDAGQTVAKVRKTIYVREKKQTHALPRGAGCL